MGRPRSIFELMVKFVFTSGQMLAGSDGAR
jgi:hypothetical protein